MAAITSNGPRGGGSFVFFRESDCVCCPNTATGPGAIVRPIDSYKEICLSSKEE